MPRGRNSGSGYHNRYKQFQKFPGITGSEVWEDQLEKFESLAAAVLRGDPTEDAGAFAALGMMLCAQRGDNMARALQSLAAAVRARTRRTRGQKKKRPPSA